MFEVEATSPVISGARMPEGDISVFASPAKVMTGKSKIATRGSPKRVKLSVKFKTCPW